MIFTYPKGGHYLYKLTISTISGRSSPLIIHMNILQIFSFRRFAAMAMGPKIVQVFFETTNWLFYFVRVSGCIPLKSNKKSSPLSCPNGFINGTLW